MLIGLEDLDVSNATGCADAPTTASVPDSCSRCDVMLGLVGVHVEAVERTGDLMRVTVSTRWQLMGCLTCGSVAPSRGRRRWVLNDVPHAAWCHSVVATVLVGAGCGCGVQDVDGR